MTFIDLIIYKGKQREKKGKTRNVRKSWTLERPPRKLTLFSTWLEVQLLLSQCGGLVQGDTIQCALTAHTDLSVKNRSISLKESLVKQEYVPKELDHFAQVNESKSFDVETEKSVSMGKNTPLVFVLGPREALRFDGRQWLSKLPY